MSLSKSRFIELFGSTDLSLQKDDWVEIKSIGEVVSGSTPKTTNESYWGGENKWITPAELSSDTYVITKTDRYLTDEGVKSCSLRKLPKNTVLLTSRAPIGKVAIAGTEMYCNQGFKNIICNETVRPKYLFYLLKNNVRYLEYLGRGATFKEISKSIVENVKIPLFPIQEQDRFIEFAEQIDKSKFLLQKILEKLELLKKSRFIEMFDLYKEKKLSEVAEIIMGQSPDSNSYNNTEMGLPFYQGKTEFSDKYIGSPVTWCSSPCRIAEKNDILMSVRAPVGDVNIATEKCCIGRGLASIRPLDGESTFLFYALKLKKAEIASKGNGSTFKAINKETVHSITIPDVPQELKVKFSMFAEQIDKSKLVIQKSLEDLVGKS